jgi:hypothetical protein
MSHNVVPDIFYTYSLSHTSTSLDIIFMRDTDSRDPANQSIVTLSSLMAIQATLWQHVAPELQKYVYLPCFLTCYCHSKTVNEL